MTRALSRTHSANTANSSSTKFAHSSRLIRTLTELSVSDVEPSQADLAEKLGQLFDFSDALALSAAHEQGAKVALQFQTGAVTDTAASGRAHDVSLQQDVLQAVETEVLQVRSQLVNGIARSCAPHTNATRIKLPSVKPDAPAEAAMSYESFHRFYGAHQQEMHGGLRTLQANVRAAMSDVSPQLKQLAILDGAFDEILRERAWKLFAAIPKLLQQRYEQLYHAHQQKLSPQQTDDPALWMQPGGWLERFCREMQGLLLAELDVRLQPVLGLVDALRQEVTTAA